MNCSLAVCQNEIKSLYYSIYVYGIINAEVIILKLQMHLRIRDLREDNDLSQAEMAKLLQCSQQTYSRYESHITEIPLESLIFLAEYYDTSVDYLLGITKQKKPYPRD